jgi:hypothetical protein
MACLYKELNSHQRRQYTGCDKEEDEEEERGGEGGESEEEQEEEEENYRKNRKKEYTLLVGNHSVESEDNGERDIEENDTENTGGICQERIVSCSPVKVDVDSRLVEISQETSNNRGSADDGSGQKNPQSNSDFPDSRHHKTISGERRDTLEDILEDEDSVDNVLEDKRIVELDEVDLEYIDPLEDRDTLTYKDIVEDKEGLKDFLHDKETLQDKYTREERDPLDLEFSEAVCPIARDSRSSAALLFGQLFGGGVHGGGKPQEDCVTRWFYCGFVIVMTVIALVVIIACGKWRHYFPCC